MVKGIFNSLNYLVIVMEMLNKWPIIIGKSQYRATVAMPSDKEKSKIEEIAKLSKFALGKMDEAEDVLDEGASASEEPILKKYKKEDVSDSEETEKTKKKTGNSFGRFNTQKTVSSGTEGEEKPKKTSVVFRGTPLKSLGLKESDFRDELGTMETYTPIKEITEYSKTGTPLKARSESGTELSQLSSTGMVVYFINRPQKKSEDKLEIDPTFKESAIAKKIKPLEASEKIVSIEVTPELLKLVGDRIKELQGRRSVTQGKVMGGSASEYSHAAGLSLGIPFEWGHLVAHRFLSDVAQVAENLVSITKHANSEMMPVEDFVSAYVKDLLGKVKLEVTAFTIDETQNASFIHYNVYLGDHVLPFKFNAQQAEQPDIANKESMEILLKILKKKIKETKKEEELSSPSPVKGTGTSKVFYSKSSNTFKTKEASSSPPEVTKEEESSDLVSSTKSKAPASADKKTEPPPLSIKFADTSTDAEIPPKKLKL